MSFLCVIRAEVIMKIKTGVEVRIEVKIVIRIEVKDCAKKPAGQPSRLFFALTC